MTNLNAKRIEQNLNNIISSIEDMAIKPERVVKTMHHQEIDGVKYEFILMGRIDRSE